MAIGNKEVTDLPLLISPNGAEVYAVKTNTDYRVAVGVPNGIATLDSDGKLTPSQAVTPGITDIVGLQTALDTKASRLTSIVAGAGLTGGGTIEFSRVIELGKPSSTTLTTVNYASVSSHTHAFEPGGTSSQYIRGDGTLATLPIYPGGTVTKVESGNGLIGTVTTSGSISLGTPESITLSSSNSVTASSHTHAFIPGGTAAQYIRGNGTLATLPAPGLSAVNLGVTTATTSVTITNTGGSNAVIPAATASAAGLVTTGNQTWGGTKTAVNFAGTSDARLKKHIKEIEPEQHLADMLRFYSYTWINTEEEAVGLIAQEVKKVAPEYVVENEEGFLAIDKAGIALECVLGLAKRVHELEETLNRLLREED